MGLTDKQLDNIFTYHTPQGNQAERYTDLRDAARKIAQIIQLSCPESREKSLAITNLQQSVMWANASIAINEDRDDSSLEI